jgi:copper chaperone CopZ
MLSALLLVSETTFSQDKKETKEKKEAEITFSVPIDCPSCQKKLEAKLPFEKGVKDFAIDLEKQTIWFLYKTKKTDKASLVKALDKLGYKAVEIKKEEKEKKKKNEEKDE